MSFIKKYFVYIFEPLYFASVFLVGIIPLGIGVDIWYHMKVGQIIAERGIIHYDVLSYLTSGREAHPFEWLFQISMYYISALFGLDGVKYFTAFLVVILIFLLYLLLKYLFKLNYLIAGAVSFMYLSMVYEYITARPHLVAYICLLGNLILILFYLQKDKNLLYLTIPLTYIWTNLHGSIILNNFIFISYTFISLLSYFFLKEKKHRRKSIIMAIYTLITFLVTVAPPLYLTQYKTLFLFYQYRDVVRKIIEWTPLFTFTDYFYEYTIYTIVIFLFTFLIVYKNKEIKKSLWLIPIIGLSLMPFTAVRYGFLGFMGLSILLGYSTSKVSFQTISLKTKMILILLGIGVLCYSAFRLHQKYQPVNISDTNQAVEFLKKYQLHGRMLNQFPLGGYLSYNLYPTKIFMDGRGDLYFCCELPEYLEIFPGYIGDDINKYKKKLDRFLSKHDISYFVMYMYKGIPVWNQVSEILYNNPNWTLAYWDDYNQIFINNDNKNTQVFNVFKTVAATPYSGSPYREGTEELAFQEYTKMISIQDSAKSRNAVGTILMKKNQLDEAQKHFEKAIKLNPRFESPYMNLGEIYNSRGQTGYAIQYYGLAKKLKPNSVFIYKRLSQFYIAMNDITSAKKILQDGLDNVITQEAKNELTSVLQEL